MVKNELVTKIYPLHDSEKLKAMELEWYGSIIGSQVITNVRDYFGKFFNWCDFMEYLLAKSFDKNIRIVLNL